jgi:hypothetical protein
MDIQSPPEPKTSVEALILIFTGVGMVVMGVTALRRMKKPRPTEATEVSEA